MIDKQTIPLLDLKAQFKRIENDIRDAIDSVLQSQIFVMGPEVASFEEEMAAYSGVRHAIAVSSGTDALLVSLMALDVGPGDEVITSPYTFFATGGAIARLGAKPVFIDIEPETYNMDGAFLESAITQRTKAIIPVHLFGQCAEMYPILEISKRHDIPVIEDAAQAIGATYKEGRAGSMGLIGCNSFFPSKNLGGFGDGGMVVTSDDDMADKIRVLRVHGSKPKYFHSVVGGNFRLDAIQAAVLRVKLKHLDTWNGERGHNARLYDKKLAQSDIDSTLLSTPIVRQESHIYHQYIIRTPHRDALQDHLRANNIGCQIYFPLPLHLQDCFKDLGYGLGSLPVSEAAARETIALPVYPELSEGQIDYVVSVIVEFFQNNKN